MESLVECSQCGVLMTTWCPAGSLTRYYQCPFCKRTLCSSYGEVFERGTLARRIVPTAKVTAAPPSHASGAVPTATPEDRRLREIKGRAARWFARLQADGDSHAPRHEVATASSAARVPA